MTNKNFTFILSLFGILNLCAQNNTYWQQKVDYTINLDMDVETYQYKGTQKLVYTNNSPDTLKKVYFHLYNNAFQPGSEMDARIQSIKDPDARMTQKTKIDGKDVKTSRMQALKPNEIGLLEIKNCKQDGKPAIVNTKGTIAEIILPKPILPNSKTCLDLDFFGQVPIQIRRSGRNNSEGVALSMAQWYPKIAEFDFEGWHADPYIAREFHGVWGDFDVKITIDKNYTLAGTGYLQNPKKIGHGYQKKESKNKKTTKDSKLTWHFVAPMVHDFTWAADANYVHDIIEGPNKIDLHFFYKNEEETIQKWKQIQPIMAKVMALYNNKIGNYPYKQYSFIQGGDGGMEYAMCTLILGNGTVDGIVGTAIHELGHSWFQHLLGSNESKHPWMDEGFTTYIEYWVENEINPKKKKNPFESIYRTYINWANTGKEQPQTTHGDRYDENRSYAISSYFKGCLYLSQLGYLIGEDNLDKTIKRYFQDFKFKHPTPNDITRTAERISGAQLNWYLTDWTQTTNTIDYAIKDVNESIGYNGIETQINLERIGRMPMPIDILVEYVDGSLELFYIPLRMMHFEKENQNPSIKRTTLKDWAWAESKYIFSIPKSKSSIKKITIDPEGLMADVKLDNNSYKQN